MKSLNLIFTLLSLIFIGNSLCAKEFNYKLDPSHSHVSWQASHFNFSMQSGKFSFVEGDLFFDEKKPAKSRVLANIKIANVETGDKKFNEHLLSKDFFDVKNFSLAKFKSNKIKITGKNTGKIYGDLTLLGKSKKVVLNAKFNKIGINPITKKRTVGFSASTTIKRSDFGMKTYLPGISDKVKINIEVEAAAI